MPLLPTIVSEPTFVPRHQFEADEGMVFLQIEADSRRFTVYVADCLIDDLTGMGDDNGTYTEAQALQAVAVHLRRYWLLPSWSAMPTPRQLTRSTSALRTCSDGFRPDAIGVGQGSDRRWPPQS